MCHFATPPSLHALAMSLNVAASAPAYVCHNPHCTSRRTSFACEKTFTMRCQRSPACLVFIRDDTRGSETSTTTSHAAYVNNPIMTRTKRASLLHCEIINEQHVGDDTAKEFLLSNVDTNYDDYYNALDMMTSNYDSDDYTWEGIVLPPPPSPPPLSRQPLMFTTDQKWTVALLKLLDNVNAPDYAEKRWKLIHFIGLMVDFLESTTLMCSLHHLKMQSDCCPLSLPLNSRMVQTVVASRTSLFHNC